MKPSLKDLKINRQQLMDPEIIDKKMGKAEFSL